MTSDASRQLLHPALESDGGTPLEQAQLTDRERLAVMLQGAALLAHLEHGGWFLPHGWAPARIRGDAILAAGSALPGRGAELPQVLLLGLLRRLFRARDDRDEIAGRGEARRVARELLALWRQLLTPVSPDRAVAEILETAPFLWQPAFARARAALVAEHRADGKSCFWVAGPGPARRRILKAGAGESRIEALLTGPEAFELWEGSEDEAEASELVEKGRFERAAALWRRQPPRTRTEALRQARCLFALGRFSQTLRILKPHRSLEARLLRLRCREELGELDAAIQQIYRLAKVKLDTPETIVLAETAVRILAKRGQYKPAREWVARAREASRGRGRLGLRAEILAAEAAWDRKEFDSTARRLDDTRAALEDPELARRWHEVASLLALGMRDGAAVVEHSSAVLRHRRRMYRAEAGRRWNEIGYGRVLLGDLAGAERAIRHAQRLLSATESSSRETLGLSNLAEVRLRRGRLDGVAEALEASTAANRRNRNDFGLAGDLELRVRLELVQGRPEAALSYCDEAFRLIEGNGVGDRQVFELFASRAHGWLGRPERAAACLGRVAPEVLFELEPEERPAVWALAGRGARAAEEAAGTMWAEAWSAHVAGLHPNPGVWDELRHLEAYRAGRLVYDYELIHPGVVPPECIRKAIAALRDVNAESFADRLESRSLSPWQAVERYLAKADDRKANDSKVELFSALGYPRVRLSFVRGSREHLMIAGSGGSERLEAPHEGGRLRLESSSIDAPLRALFLLIQRDVKTHEVEKRERRPVPSAGGIIGDDPKLTEAIERLDRLAAGDLPVLILGESGTGKELAAQRVHDLSRRDSDSYQAVNCAALPEGTLSQSELFGHVRGSFTGADRDRPGIFEQARGGTVFLDEIGDLSLPLQGKLLRVLQEGEIRRVGESYARKVDVRVIAATHRDLQQMVRQGKFRQDLFFRLKGATVKLPALRARGQDVVLLADHFLGQKARKEGSAAGALPAAVKQCLLRHSWPGNVRELQNAIATAATLASGRAIRPEDLGLPEEPSPSARGDYHQQIDRFRRRLIGEALEQSGGNRAAAARRLGLTRQALSYLVRQLGLR